MTTRFRVPRSVVRVVMASTSGPQPATSPDTAPFELRGELALPYADRIEPRLIAYLKEHPGEPVVIECRDLEFIDSSGLGMLVEVQNEIGRQLALEHLSDSCRHLFEIAGLEQIFVLR